MMNQAIRINKNDNVATTMQDLLPDQKVKIIDKKGCVIFNLKVKEYIKIGHKIALQDIQSGEVVFKYGYVIGKASKKINKGEYVHIHNVESQKGRGDIAK
jgi:altronate dehydratase small subunit